MFKKLLLALTFSLLASSAFAVCGAIPLPILDGTGASRNISSKSAADGNCETLIDIDASSQLHTDITAATPAGSNDIGKVHILGNAGATLDGPAGTAATQALTVQGVASMTKLLVTPDSVALPANQSVNVAQFGGVATTTGQVAVSVAPVTATNTALVTALRPDSPGIITLGPATIANSVPGIQSSQYPGNATAAANPITASTTGTTAATTATLAGVASKTTFICGFTISSDATAALAGAATVTGTVTGTLNYIQNVGSATAAGVLTQSFAPCIPASAANTGIAVNSVAAGTGGNTAVTAWGYQL